MLRSLALATPSWLGKWRLVTIRRLGLRPGQGPFTRCASSSTSHVHWQGRCLRDTWRQPSFSHDAQVGFRSRPASRTTLFRWLRMALGPALSFTVRCAHAGTRRQPQLYKVIRRLWRVIALRGHKGRQRLASVFGHLGAGTRANKLPPCHRGTWTLYFLPCHRTAQSLRLAAASH